MALMQLTFLTASPDAEKKNDELETSFDTKSESTTTTTQPKISAPQEPAVKLATKPSVPFDQLKLKSAFSLNETKQIKTTNLLRHR